MDKIYDATGTVDVSAIGYSRYKFGGGIIFTLNPDYYITNEGAMVSVIGIGEYIKNYGNFIIDKVMISTANGVYFIDIPNISYEKYVNSVKYNCQNFSIGAYMRTLLSK